MQPKWDFMWKQPKTTITGINYEAKPMKQIFQININNN